MLEICSDLFKHALKHIFFVNIQKRPKNGQWPNHFISGKQFQKGQIWPIWHLKSPHGNPDSDLLQKVYFTGQELYMNQTYQSKINILIFVTN